VDGFAKIYGVPPSNGAECAYTNMYQWKSGIERSGSLDPAKFIAKMEGYHFTATKEPEYWRSWDHQGINSCLVMEGVPIANRKDPFAYANVLQVYGGDAVAIPQSATKCKIESA